MLALYYHTLLYLKPRQVYWRLWYKFVRNRVDASQRPNLREAVGHWQSPARRRQSLLDSDLFSFLNETGHLSELSWDGPQRDKLWRYNQHYFDDLNAIDSDARTDWHHVLVDHWIRENKLGQGTGWEPYPTSLRIVNWAKWCLAGYRLHDTCLQSLASQTRWLSKRLEWHILGNHLFANAKALVFAGLLFDGPEARKWLDTGMNIIADELPEQVLPDGGNFERSPMYHAIFLEDLLDLINLANAYPKLLPCEQVNNWREVAIRMLRWLEAMCHPDGEIAFFNDAAIGIAPTPNEIKAYAFRLGVASDPLDGASCPATVAQFTESGYIRLEYAAAVALLDVAPIGPDYLPGHAHADTLSFELSVFGQRVIVNGGTSCYGLGPQRLRERQTVSHSTMEVDHQSSSEVWGGFRVARRAYPFDLVVSERPGVLSVSCSHDGYKRLRGKPVHRRSWQFSPNYIEVADSVSGTGRSAVARYILHPDVSVVQVAPDTFHLTLRKGRLILVKVGNGFGRLELACFAPEFGKVMPTQCIAVDVQDGKAQVRLSWS